MNKTAQQKKATRFSFDYLSYLLQQESVVERMVDVRFKDLELHLEHRLDKMIEEKIDQQLKHYK